MIVFHFLAPPLKILFQPTKPRFYGFNPPMESFKFERFQRQPLIEDAAGIDLKCIRVVITSQMIRHLKYRYVQH